MSCSTSTCPSQWGPAPMPIVGIVSASEIRRATAAGTSSSTMAQAPASSSAFASRQQLGRVARLPALHPVAAERVHRLRREAEMADHRDAALHQRPHRLRHVAPALQLHSVRAGLLQHAAGVADRLRDRHLVGQERQVHEQQRAAARRAAPRPRGRSSGRGWRSAWSRARASTWFSESPTSSTSTSASLQQPGEGGVVAGEHHDPAARGLHRRRGRGPCGDGRQRSWVSSSASSRCQKSRLGSSGWGMIRSGSAIRRWP